MTDTSIAAAESVTAKVFSRRYKDAYRTAKAVGSFGDGLKGLGAVLGVIIALGAGSQMGAAGFLSGVIVGALFWVFGVFVSAQGQLLLAALDGAVNSSPFLSNEEKLKVMS